MKTDNKIIEVFCKVDDFCKKFSEQLKKRQIENKLKKRNRVFTMSESEVITIAICFHLGGFRNFKHFNSYV